MDKEEIMILLGKLMFTLNGTELLTEVTDALNELLKYKQIDNSNPSKALECLDRLDNTLCLNNIKGKLEFGIDTEEHTDCDSVIGMTEDLETIKNFILKAQEPKKYLKWEDLTTTKTYKCLLNGNEYVVDYYSPQECDPYWRVRLISPTRGVFIVLRENYDKQFFNDLHLEVVE